MSIQQATSERQRQQRRSYDHDPDDVFEQAICNTGTVCSSCFRQRLTPVVMLVPVEHAENDMIALSGDRDAEMGEDSVPCTTFEPAESVDACHPPTVNDPLDELDVPPVWKRSTPPKKTYCECGAVDDEPATGRLSKEDALRHAKRLSKRLDEQSIEHDARELKRRVVMYKKVPWLTNCTDAIFRHAVEVAVCAVRRGVEPRELKRGENGGVRFVDN